MKMFSIASYCILNVILIVFIVYALLYNNRRMNIVNENAISTNKNATKIFKLQLDFILLFFVLQFWE